MATNSRFEIEFGDERIITPGGLSVVGMLMEQTNLRIRLNQSKYYENARPDIQNYDIAMAMIGVLSQGKSSFDSAAEFKDDIDFFTSALRTERIPAPETLRQRLDVASRDWRKIILEENINLINRSKAQITECSTGHIPIDVDVSPFDNSKTAKQEVSRTYKGFDGYAPIFSYIGVNGILLNLQLRAGKDHCQKDTEPFLRESITYAKQLTEKPLLVRMDSGNDSSENIKLFDDSKVDYIVKRNLRNESLQDWLDMAISDESVKILEPRDGKTIYIGSTSKAVKKVENPVRIAYEITVRTMTSKGQILLEPEIEVNSWWTSLNIAEEEVIVLYKAHATCEQFHSEIKTDMDIERLPSKYFKTNSLVLELSVLAYNALRIIGQESIKFNDSPARKEVSRVRIKTVIQNLITIACKIVNHARKVYMRLGRSNAWRFTFKRIYEAFA